MSSNGSSEPRGEGQGAELSLKHLKFWHWFFSGSGGKPGFRRLLDRWLLVHIPVGVAVASFTQGDIALLGNVVVLPLAGILIGLAFAWSGNAQALLQEDEIALMSDQHEGGFIDFVFAYQLAILLLLTTIVLWGFAGLGVFSFTQRGQCSDLKQGAIRSLLFAFSSLSLRSCWRVVASAGLLLISRKVLRDALRNQNSDDSTKTG